MSLYGCVYCRTNLTYIKEIHIVQINFPKTISLVDMIEAVDKNYDYQYHTI